MAFGTEYFGETAFGSEFSYLFYNLCMSAVTTQHFFGIEKSHFHAVERQHYSGIERQHFFAEMSKC